ncbi:MAG TPA: aldo/keto reductase [Candidatus Thermoplasmatota archaeon]|nr:aldo/keto reductase [Candidatus Thermoplasmatota archaeon]
MLYKRFGWTGVEVSVIGQGTWQVRDKKAGAAALEAGLAAGMTHIDTAELYTGSEQMIAPLLEGRRDQVFLVSKVLPRNASYKGTLEHCQKSLDRLGTDYLDVYLQHWRTDTYPLEDTMRALGELVDSGKIRYLGVSNFDVEDLEEVESYLGRHKIACNQVLYNLQDRSIEEGVLPWCREHDVALVGYSPFGTGNFPGPNTKGGKVLAAVAQRLGKTPHQVALAFLTREPLLFTIPKTENPDHARVNAGGAFELPREAVAEIDAAFPLHQGLHVR